MRIFSVFTYSTFQLIAITAFIFSCVPREFERPNIILIMADDLGYGDISCYGDSSVQTPNLDKLATEGLRFTDFHANGAVCSPTRAALLTGRYQQRSGIEGVIYARGETRQTGLAVEEYTFADYMKSVGYATGIVGKWHLGYRIDYNPIYQGFDYFRGYVSGNVDYHSHVDGAGIPDWWHDLEKTDEEGYVTDLITKYSLEFIENNKDQLFCLYIAHEAPHYPFQGRKDKADRYPGGRFPAHGSRKDKKSAYREMIEVMDEGIGSIVEKLKDLKLEDNTLIIFCSDNGGLGEIGNNGKLRGSKGSLWEGGHRVPAIAYWPGYIEPGTTTDQTVLSMDFFPTFVNLSKVTTNPDFQFDGVDITTLLIEDNSLDDRSIFWKYRDQKVVRYGNWKLLVNNDTTYLFNLDEDLSEKINLADSESSIVSQLKLELDSWEEEVMKGVKLKTE